MKFVERQSRRGLQCGTRSAQALTTELFRPRFDDTENAVHAITTNPQSPNVRANNKLRNVIIEGAMSDAQCGKIRGRPSFAFAPYAFTTRDAGSA